MRAAAGVTMVISAVVLSYACFTQQYVPLQVVASSFFAAFLIRESVRNTARSASLHAP